MSEAGILLNSKGIDSRSHKPEYDSRVKTVTVDLSPSLGHAQIIPMNIGTEWTQSAGAGNIEWTEDFVVIPHKMGFKPKVLSFYYVTDVPTDRTCSVTIGSYYPDRLPAVTNAFGYGEESFETVVDETNVIIRHNASAVGSISDFKANGAALSFRFRMLVTQLEDLS